MPKFLHTLGSLLPAALDFGPGKRKKKICLFGADTSGKTTFLYRLKLGYAVTTIPTIGFNVETVPWTVGAGGRRDGKGEGKQQEWEFDFYDVGGCDKMAPLMHHFIDPDTAVLFIHDCSSSSTDPWRLEVSVELLHLHIGQMRMKGAEVLLVLLSKQDAIPGGESERRKKVDELRGLFEKELAKYDEVGGQGKGEDDGKGEQGIRGRWLKWQILAPRGMSASTGEGIDLVMDDVCLALSAEPARAAKDHAEMETKMKDVVRRDKPPTAEELDVLASEAVSSVQPADVFWREFLDGTLVSWDHVSHLQAGYIVLIECMTQGQGVFESAEVFLRHLARLREAQPNRFRNTAHVTMTVFWLLQLHLAAVKYSASTSEKKFPVANQFRDIVLFSPSLMDRGLWKTYYSKDLLFSPDAREEWHLPDLQPLPTMTQLQRNTGPKHNPSDDRTLNSDRLTEFAFVVIKKIIVENLRRGGVVKQALTSLQKTTLQLRARDVLVPAYSETQAYFWIQMVHVALHDFVQTNEDDKTHNNITLANLDLPTFKLLYSLDGDITWREYYSTHLWQDDVTARMQFVLPDLKPLPNVIVKAGDAAVMAARKMLLHNTAARVGEAERLPSREVLGFLVDCLLHEINDSSFFPVKSMGQMGDGREPVKVRVDSHMQLLRFLHARLILGGERQDTTGGHATQASSISTSSGSKSSSHAAETLDAFILGDNDSYTEKLFWARQILLAASIAGAATSGAPCSTSFTTTATTTTLEQILRVNPQLAFDRLPLVYYSPALWHSAEARAGFVPPDLEILGVW